VIISPFYYHFAAQRELKLVDSGRPWAYQSPMTNLSDLSIGQLNRIIAIKEQIAKLEGELESVAGNGHLSIPPAMAAPKKRRMSAAWRAKIAASARARWAKAKAQGKKTL
jgi:hypothetical protein